MFTNIPKISAAVSADDSQVGAVEALATDIPPMPNESDLKSAVIAAVEEITSRQVVQPLTSSSEECEACDEDAPSGDDALPIRFGAEQIHLNAPEAFPYIVETFGEDDAVSYTVHLFGPIQDYGKDVRAAQHLIQILDHATETTDITIYISSPGGVVSVASTLTSAMHRTKGKLKTVAVGAVMSAATVIWMAGQVREIRSGAMFMFHWSSHGAYGNSRGVTQRSEAISSYAQRVMLQPAVDQGFLTGEEMDMILAQEDVFIPASVMQDRLRAVEDSAAADDEPSADTEETPAGTDVPGDQDIPDSDPIPEDVPEDTSDDDDGAKTDAPEEEQN